MPQVTEEHVDDGPSDEALVRMRHAVDRTEAELQAQRHVLAKGIQSAIAGGASMAHVARTVGWSRQWCYNALSRWLPAPDS